MLAHLVAVGFDHFPRDGPHARRVREVVHEPRARPGELDLEGITVQRAHAAHVPVVVEPAARLERLLPQRRQVEDLLVFEPVELRALPARIVESLERIHVVLRGQLALLSAECRVVGEVDSRSYAYLERPEVFADRGHFGRGVRLQSHRPGEILESERRLENIRHDGVRVQVAVLRRVKAGLRDAKRIAKHFLRLGCRRVRFDRCPMEEAKHDDSDDSA